MGNHGAFFRNAGWQYGLQVAKYLFPFVTLPYLTRVLEPEGYALYAYVVALMTFAGVAIDFGFNLSGTRLIAESRSRAETNQIIGALTIARLMLVVPVGLIILVVGSIVPILQGHQLYVLLAFLAVCVRILAPDYLFQGLERMGPLSVRYFLSAGTSTAFVFVLVGSEEDILWLPILDILASLIALGWTVFSAKRLFGANGRWVNPRSALKALVMSGPYFLSNVSAVGLTGLSTLTLGIVVSSPQELAYWALAITVITAVQSLYTPITNSLYPHMVRTRDFGFVRKIMLRTFPVVLVGTGLLAVLAPFIMRVLGGESYESGADILRWLSPLLVSSFLVVMLGWPVLGAAGKIRSITVTTVVSSVFNLVALGLSATMGFATVGAVIIIRNLTELLLLSLRTVYARSVWR